MIPAWTKTLDICDKRWAPIWHGREVAPCFIGGDARLLHLLPFDAARVHAFSRRRREADRRSEVGRERVRARRLGASGQVGTVLLIKLGRTHHTQEAARAAWLFHCPEQAGRLDRLAGCLTALIEEEWPERRERPGIAAHLGPWPAPTGTRTGPRPSAGPDRDHEADHEACRTATMRRAGPVSEDGPLPESLPGSEPNTGAGAKYSPVSEPNTGQMGWSL